MKRLMFGLAACAAIGLCGWCPGLRGDEGLRRFSDVAGVQNAVEVQHQRPVVEVVADVPGRRVQPPACPALAGVRGLDDHAGQVARPFQRPLPPGGDNGGGLNSAQQGTAIAMVDGPNAKKVARRFGLANAQSRQLGVVTESLQPSRPGFVRFGLRVAQAPT